MFIESDLRFIEGKIEKIIFNEKAQEVTLVVNQINYTIFMRTTYYFKIGDSVKIVFHGKYDEIDAVLNMSNGCLYLYHLIYEVNPKYLKDKMSKVAFYAVCSMLILVIELIIYQLVMDGTVYYFDITKYVSVVAPIAAGYMVYYVLQNLNRGQHHYSQKVFELLGLPNLEQAQLNCLRMTNSYFEVIENLYFMKHVLNITKKHNITRSKELIDRICRQKNTENLTEFQELRFKVQYQKGKIEALKKVKIPESYIHTDPFIEVQASLNGLPIYGYFDEFYVEDKQEVEAVLTEFRDEKGYYIWYLYDGKRYLYLDEDQPSSSSERYGWAEATITTIMFGFFLFILWLFFAFAIDFAFFSYVYFAIMVFIALYQIAKVLFDRKFNQESKTGFYVYQQIARHAKLPQYIYLNKLIDYRLIRSEKAELTFSRTGYDLTKSKASI